MPKDRESRYALRVPSHLYEQVKERAGRAGISMNEYIIRALIMHGLNSQLQEDAILSERITKVEERLGLLESRTRNIQSEGEHHKEDSMPQPMTEAPDVSDHLASIRTILGEKADYCILQIIFGQIHCTMSAGSYRILFDQVRQVLADHSYDVEQPAQLGHSSFDFFINPRPTAR